VWPPGIDGGPGPPAPIANPLERTRRAAAAEAAAGLFVQRTAPGSAPPGQVLFDELGDAKAFTAEEAQALALDPQGSFLLASRVPWLVRYRVAVTTGGVTAATGAGQQQAVLREVLHRPGGGEQHGGAGGGGGREGKAAAAAGGPAALVVSSYMAATGQLMARYKQRCYLGRQPFTVGRARSVGRALSGLHFEGLCRWHCYGGAGTGPAMPLSSQKYPTPDRCQLGPSTSSLRYAERPRHTAPPLLTRAHPHHQQVVAAAMTPSQRDLLLFCHVARQQDDPDSFRTLTVMVRRGRAWQASHWWLGLAVFAPPTVLSRARSVCCGMNSTQ
jgi:hypothetical protein